LLSKSQASSVPWFPLTDQHNLDMARFAPKSTDLQCEVLVAGVVKKRCGRLQQYESRYCELRADRCIWCYYKEEHRGQEPYKKVALEGMVLVHNADSVSGFSLKGRDVKDPVSIIAPNIEQKKLWMFHLNSSLSACSVVRLQEIGPPSTSVGSPSTPACRAKKLDRSKPSQMEEFLMKQQKLTLEWHQRWVELREGVLYYSKFQSSEDESFKAVRLTGARVSVHQAKLKFRIDPVGSVEGAVFKSGSTVSYQRWLDAIRRCVERLETFVDDDGVGGAAAEEEPDPQAHELSSAATREELEDLKSAIPRKTAQPPLMLVSIGEEYHPTACTPNYETQQLRAAEANFGDFGVKYFLDRFLAMLHDESQLDSNDLDKVLDQANRMDVDARVIKKFMKTILDQHGHEEAARDLLASCDHALCQYLVVRESLGVILGIAEARDEMISSVRQNINGSLKELIGICSGEREGLVEEKLQRANLLVRAVEGWLEEFRVSYDFFEEAYDTISEVTGVLEFGRHWIAVSTRSNRADSLMLPGTRQQSAAPSRHNSIMCREGVEEIE
jgi:hypothetical protein